MTATQRRARRSLSARRSRAEGRKLRPPRDVVTVKLPLSLAVGGSE